MDVKWTLVLLLLPLILLNFIKSLKYLTPASLTASVLTISGLGITFFFLLQGLPRTNTVHAFASLSSLPLYFGTAIYAFEGISLVSWKIIPNSVDLLTFFYLLFVLRKGGTTLETEAM